MSILKAPASLTLIVSNIIVFFCILICEHQGILRFTDAALIDSGASFGPITVREWWRIPTSMSVHNGAIHLTLNLLALSVAGPMLETEVGGLTTFAIFLICGVAGATSSLLWNPTVISCGASGAIFGVVAAALANAWVSQRLKDGAVRRSAVIVSFASLLYCVVLGLFTPGIDNANHIGGLVTGLLLGSALGFRSRRNKGALVAILSGTVAALACMLLMLAGLPQQRKAVLQLAALKQQSAALMADKNYREALEVLNTAIALAPDDKECHIARAEARTDVKEFNGTVSDCNKVLAIDYRNKGALLMLDKQKSPVLAAAIVKRANAARTRAYSKP